MIRNPHGRDSRLRPHLFRGAVLAALAAGTQSGCTREFYREWANQDVSEAVFEKSRDPRWRLDLFSIEPPAQSRFADPYDQDFPPAPPDDPATEALSPVPQWPDNRLIMPVEGTGYLSMMERWKAESAGLQPTAVAPGTASPPGAGDTARPPESPAPPGPAATPSPFAAPPRDRPQSSRIPANSGPERVHSSPTLLAKAGTEAASFGVAPSQPVAGAPARPKASGPPSTDGEVRRASRQETQPPEPGPSRQPNPGAERLRNQPEGAALPPRAPVPLDPNPSERDMGQPGLPRPDQMVPAGPGGTFSEAQAAELAGILVPYVPSLNEAAASGLPSNARPYKVTMQQAFTLALINSRFYQTQLENLYAAALSVTLARFQFAPQFYAGMSPRTSPLGPLGSLGFPGVVPANQFLYQTRKAPGGQISTLTLGEVAGFGKVLNSGGQLLMGFANQVVFNFVGKNPMQPTLVQSSLPLTFVQPFLRGGGRAVVLETLTQTERNLVYQARLFAKFRQEFIVSILTGGQVQNFGQTFNLAGFSIGGNIDPVVGFLPVMIDVAQIDVDRKNVATLEQIVNLYKQLIEGEASGLSQLQVDQAESSLVQARGTLVGDLLTYRSQLDQFKIQLGLPPDVPMIPDLGLAQPFFDVFSSIDRWQRNPGRDLDDLPRIVGRLPELEDVIIDGRSLLNIYKGQGSRTFTEEDQLEQVLQAGVRIALEFRLDLMNQRAALYDAWRQLRVTANALEGILNVAITNQVFTPPTTTNPFGFFSQAKQFSLVLNAELPLIRLSERNAFRNAIIAYQRQRRTLQNAEDQLKYQLRNDIRSMQVSYINYEIARRNLVLAIRLRDQAFEQILAPPQAGAGAGGVGQTANAATQTTNLLNFQGQLIRSEQTLLATWQTFELNRLTLYRDIGTLPYDEWEAFSELFPAEYRGASLGPGTSNTGPAAAPAANPPQGVGR
jgi:hypothetical protein